MKKHYILFIACCFAALSAWADTSITETYVTNPYSGAQTSRVSYNGRYTEWYFRNARSGGKNDKLNDDTKGFWLSRTANSCYLESTFEGGVKHVAFKWKQFSTGDNGFKFVLNIITKVGSAAAVTQQSYSFDGDADHTNTDQSYSQTVAIKDNNVKLTIQNSSTQSDGSTVGGRLIIGPVTITPYLLYTQKDITIGSKQQGYYNAELIDNTDSEGSISYSSGNESVALVDAESGVVTPVSAGNVVITATWSEGASTTYTLHVVDGIIAENFSKVSQTSQTPDATTWHGDLFDWRGHCLRRGTDDTIGLAPRIQATAFRRLSDVGSYIHTRSVVEGGVKHVAFDWRQWASGTSPLAMNLYYSADDENWGDVVATQSVDAVGAAEPHTFDYDVDNGAIGNAYMKLVFTSGAGHAVMGAMKITPWLLYTTKEATLDTRGSGALTYTNPDLIDNTGSTVTYSIENYGGIPEEKISIAADGTVTVADRYQTGDITVQAKWSEVTTTYTLHVVGKAETEVSYEVTEVYKTFGDAIFFNPLTITHAGSNPTFSSTQENVATINEFGNVTIVGAGTTTIKATFAETDTYKGAEVSYTLIVRPIVRLMGINDDWTTGLTLTMAADGNTASYTLENQEGADNKYIDFKLQVAGEWRSTDYTFNRDYPEASNITSNNDKNMKVRIDLMVPTPSLGLTKTMLSRLLSRRFLLLSTTLQVPLQIGRRTRLR